MNFKPIPPDSTKLEAHVNICGDEECNCCHLTIYAYRPYKEDEYKPSWGGELTGEKLCDIGWLEVCDFLNEYKQELNEAFAFYGLKTDPEEDADTSVWAYDCEKDLLTGIITY